MSKALAGAALGVVVLVAVFSIPILIDAEETRPQASVSLAPGESTEVNSRVKVTALSTGANQATFALTNPRTGNSTEVSFTQAETSNETRKNVTLDGYQVNVTLESATSDTALAIISHNASMGMTPQSRTIWEQSETYLVLMFGVFCLAAIFKVVS